MDHITYQETNNKGFDIYKNKFKKMVKEDLAGDGYFLLVNDFPFKDGNNLMFTAGENIDSWASKQLVSLYGKTNYIKGRCRKKGAVLTLLDFEEGDYIKKATESGLRKELKEYFKGTGVSVRVFKSVKVTEVEPEEEVDDELEMSTEAIGGDSALGSELQSIKSMESLGQKRNAIMGLINKVMADAKTAGITDQGAYNVHVNNLKRHIGGGKIDPALQEIEAIIQMIAAAAPEGEDPTAALREEKKRLQDLSNKLRKDAIGKLESLLSLVEESEKEGAEDNTDDQLGLIEETEKILNEILTGHMARLGEIETQLKE